MLAADSGLRNWLRDDIFRRFLRNASYLSSGSVAASALALTTLVFVGRALGPELLGILALIEAYVRLIDTTVRLESWQAVIKFGADALERGRHHDFERLVKFGLLIDLGGAVLAALTAAGGAYVVGAISGWSAETIELVSIYSLVLLFRLSSTPTAVLRLFDRFGILASQQVIIEAQRLLLVVVAFFAGAGLWTFLLIGMFSSLLTHAIIGVAGLQELRRRGYGGFLRRPLTAVTRLFPGIWSFVWSMNLSVLIRRSTREADTLIVGGVLGPAAAGLFHVAKKLGDTVLKVGVPIQQAIYPDLARLWARSEIDRFRTTVGRINFATGVLMTLALPIVALKIDLLITWSFGPEFTAAAVLVIVQLAASITSLYGTANRAALQSMGKHRQLLQIVIMSTVVFFTFLATTVGQLGAISASVAHLLFNTVWLISTGVVVAKGIRAATASAQAD